MTFFQRFRSLFSHTPVSPSVDVSTVAPILPGSTTVFSQSLTDLLVQPEIITFQVEPLPNWLADEASLRDEGVLFGLADTRPDGKIAQIRAFFARQTTVFDALLDENTEKISELNLLIEQRESRILTLRDQLSDLQTSQPRPNDLIRTIVSLLLSVVMCIGNFYLIDEILSPIFPNRLIVTGIFLAGMFNLFSRRSFFYEEGTRLSVRRVVAETGLPLAASVFILAQALQTQSVGQAVASFAFVLFLFLLGGSLFLSTLSKLQTELATIDANRQLALDKAQKIPVLETEIERLSREIDTIRTKKWPIVTTLTHVQTELARLNTKRDELVNLFMSEFELARSIRDRLSEQQREAMFK